MDPMIQPFDDEGATEQGKNESVIEFDPINGNDAARLNRQGFDRNQDITKVAGDQDASTDEVVDVVERNSLRESNDAIVARATDRVQEVVSERQWAQGSALNRVGVWQRNNMRYLGDHWSIITGNNGASGPWVTQYNIEGAPLAGTGLNRPGTRLFTDNRTQNAIITTVQNQMSRPPVAKLSAIEAQGRRKIFLKAEAGFRLQDSGFDYGVLGIVPDQVVNPDVQNEDDGPVLPLTERQYQRILRTPELVQPQPVLVPDPATGMVVPSGQTNPAILSDEDFWFVDDEMAANTAQKVFDIKCSEAMVEMVFSENVLYTSIYGHCPLLVSWNPAKHSLQFSNMHVLHTYPDPTATCLKDMNYLIFDYLVPADAAIARWPWATKAIKAYAAQGQRTDQSAYAMSSVYANTDFKRDMLLVRTMWERDLPVPMTVDEAMASGKVIEKTVKVWINNDGEEVASAVEATVAATDDLGSPVYDDQGQPVTVSVGMFAADDVAREFPLVEGPEKTVYVLADTGEECNPEEDGREASDNWPTMMGVRQTQILMASASDGGGQVIEKSRCPYADIPVGWNVNIPEPWRPYGQGEPYRLEDVQQLINRLWTIMFNHSRYYQFPMELWPESLLARIKNSGNQSWSLPGRCIGVPDQQWSEMAARGIQTGFFTQPAPIPAWMVNLLQMAMNEHDRLSGNTAVLQGNMPSANASGRTVETLKESARSVIAYKSMFSQWAFEHVGKVALDAIVKWMPESQWKAIFSGIPWPVLREVISMIESTKWNVQFTVYSGRGVVQEIANMEAMQDYAGGAPTRLASRQLTMERRGIPNPAREIKRIDEENRAFGTAPGAPTMQQAQGQGLQRMVQDAMIQSRGEPLAREQAQENAQPLEGQDGA